MTVAMHSNLLISCLMHCIVCSTMFKQLCVFCCMYIQDSIATPKVAARYLEFGILVIANGEIGSAQSSLIESLSGVDIAAVGGITQTLTHGITTYRRVVSWISLVTVAIYITPGINNGSGKYDEEVLRCIEALNRDRKIHLALFCFPLSELPLTAHHAGMLKLYQAAGFDWTRAIIALMYASPVSTLTPACKEVHKSSNIDVATFFNERVQMWEKEIRASLVTEVGLPQEKADTVIIAPVTDDQLEKLPDGKGWFIPLLLDILAFVPPAVYFRFLQMHRDKASFTHLIGKDAERFQKIAQEKDFWMRVAAVLRGAHVDLDMYVYYALNGNITKVFAAAARASIGAKLGAAVRSAVLRRVNVAFGAISTDNLKPVPVSENLTNLSMVKGFTENECHALYQAAIASNPTITLHIAKAMTIGPPRVGKTALRHLLLELPLPEVSISTSVMKTAETVRILSSDETTSAENQLPRAANADMELIHIGCEDEWVLVNETSGILSLLSHLNEQVMDTVKHGDLIPEAAMAQVQSHEVECANSAPVLSELIQPEAQSCLTHTDSEPAPSEPEQDKVTQPIASTSASATAEETTQVSAVVNQLYELLQTPDVANIILPDAKLLQFLDCGGQLAYHDILPIFSTIPAIYLHVFDLTQDLAAYPEDQICLSTAEGEVPLHSQSPLSVADMMSQSVMTITSLADKRVQLPEGVLLSEPPKPHIVFVGTHLDELTKKCNNIKPTFDATSETLHSVLKSEPHSVEAMVVKNRDKRLPAMFFPVSCKQSVHSDVGSLAVKQLKRRIKTFVSEVKVKVPVKWYIYQMLEISCVKEQRAPVHKYSDLFRSCFCMEFVGDVMEFHTMITYFHALGLLIHACNKEAHWHSEDSACLIFTNPSYLFENVSKLFHVQFQEEIRCEGSLHKLKREGKLTEKTLKDLKVDSTQMTYKAFMDVLVTFYIGADIVDSTGNEDRTLFIPSVLPVKQISRPVAAEQSCHFVIAFNEKPFVPCGVYAGAIARLQSLEDWMIITASGTLSRSNASFGIAVEDTVYLFNCSSHIRVELNDCDGQKAQKYRDEVLMAVTKSYCFLFHAKPMEGQLCTTCWEHPYLELGLTCHYCEKKSDHIATLRLEDGEAKTVRCTITKNTRKLCEEDLELFGCIQNNVSVHGLACIQKYLNSMAECMTREVIHCMKAIA